MHSHSAHKILRSYLSGTSAVAPVDCIRDISRASFDLNTLPPAVALSSIDLLCEVASCRNNLITRKTAVSALYKDIIETLCDDFSSAGVDTCNTVLVRMIRFIRGTNEGIHFDDLLRKLGYFNEESILSRYSKIRQCTPLSQERRKKIKKIILLSRVTVGADVAITSVILHRLSSSFPEAEIVTAGPAHLAEIFHGLPRVHWTKFYYEREGGLLGRLTAWTSLYKLLEPEWQGMSADQVLLVDPDSRLSQLGLLPIVPDSCYAYFNSRDDQAENIRISELTNKWLDNLLGEQIQQPPHISIRPAHSHNIKNFLGQFTRNIKRLVINFGVGNDAKKRLPDPFEKKLLLHILCQDDILVILDSGCHPHERTRARLLMQEIESHGVSVAAVTEKNLCTQKIPFQSGLICFQGGIGSLSAFIDQADFFFGYDSCCQHLATALDTPAVICFAGAPNDRFYGRWRPLDISGDTITVRITEKTLSDQEIEKKAMEFSLLVKKQLKEGSML